MKNKTHHFRILLLLVFIFMIAAMNVVVSQSTQTLNWRFKHPVTQQLIELGEKGSVQEGLINAGLLPDPYYGLNENEFGWIEKYQWTFFSTFNYVKSSKNELVTIKFPSIDTYAHVYVNDTLVLVTDNAFKTYRSEIQDHLLKGKNEIRVEFTPPTLYHKENYERAKYKLPAPNDKDSIAIAPYTRKAQYQFGWDWALRMVTMGFNETVTIESFIENQVIGRNIQTVSVKNGQAELHFQLFLHNDTPIKEWNSKLFGILDFEQVGTIATAKIRVNDPKLWWPRGHGEQNIYSDLWTVFGENSNNVIARKEIEFGIRTSELVQEKDQWGTSYVMKINGKEIFCKGGDYIPQDIFPARVTDLEIQRMVQIMHASNFNIVRVWGGGYYPNEAFFKECDRLGIMVWQDFMFACAMYPGDAAFLENVREELDDQIPRISSHPSVVLFNGNNEVDVAWKNWGFQNQYQLFGDDAKEIQQSYDALFKHLAPKRVETWTTLPYVHTSPLSNWGKDEFYNHGTQHYWGVWHGKDPLEDFGKKIGRFNAEFGFQSFPEYSTLSSFSTQADWNLESEVMKHHQKSYVGNGMILRHAERLYGVPKDFEEFVYFSQLTQAKAVGMAVSGHRIDMPRCSGTIYWQVNDCWPGPTWSSVDYFNNWKALQYEVRTDFMDVAVLAKETVIGKQVYYLVSDTEVAFNSNLTCKVYSIDGELLEVHEIAKNVKGKGSIELPFHKLIQPKAIDYIAVISWTNAKGEQFERSFTFLTKNRAIEPEKDYQISLKKVGDGYDIIIENSTVLVDAWIYSKNHSIHLERNFETLLPGKTIYHFQSSEEISENEVFIKYR